MSTLLHKRSHVVAAVLLAGTMVASAKAEADMPAESASVAYDIPAQALDAALDAYIRVTGAQVFYETALTAGRRSSEVKGRFAPESALRTLLTGTGLVPRRADAEAFIIAPAPPDQAGASTTPVNLNGNFLSALQTGVLGALCKDPQTRPGHYKVALELWISASGQVQHTELIGSTGDITRDAAVNSALRELAIDVALPVGTPQPLVMAIAPRSPSETGDCAVQ